MKAGPRRGRAGHAIACDGHGRIATGKGVLGSGDGRTFFSVMKEGRR